MKDGTVEIKVTATAGGFEISRSSEVPVGGEASGGRQALWQGVVASGDTLVLRENTSLCIDIPQARAVWRILSSCHRPDRYTFLVGDPLHPPLDAWSASLGSTQLFLVRSAGVLGTDLASSEKHNTMSRAQNQPAKDDQNSYGIGGGSEPGRP